MHLNLWYICVPVVLKGLIVTRKERLIFMKNYTANVSKKLDGNHEIFRKKTASHI